MLDPVTNRYADALFGLAKKRGALEDVQRDVQRLASELSHPNVAAYLFDARIPVDQRRQKLDPLVTGMHELTRNFIGLAFDKRRESVLRHLGAAFHRRLLDERGAAEGVVESARPLDPSDVDRLARVIGARLQRDVTLKNEVRADLLGGVRVIVESRMVDSSLSGRLADLKKRMLDAPLPGLSEG